MALCHNPYVTKDQFKRLRQSAGHTHASLAAAMGVHLRTVWRWELGEIKIPTVVELALTYLAEKAGKKKRGR
jgi:DNA-binding transcriptional regulator YiaG